MKKTCLWRVRLLAAPALLALTGMLLATKTNGQVEPAELLRQHGLKRIERTWVVAEELRLRQDLAELPKRRERIVALERELEERIEHNRKTWHESQPVLTTLRKSLGRLTSDDEQWSVLQQQIDLLEAASIHPVRLGERKDVRTRVVELAGERHGLTAALVRVRHGAPSLNERYERLQHMPEVVRALQQLGSNQRLGPLRNYQAEAARLEEYERLVFTAWVPVYWQGSHLRVPALVNDESSVTFTWHDSGGPEILLTTTAAEAAGLQVREDAPRETVSLSREQQTVARRISIDNLRLGKCVLADIAVLILPPEAEDWGCHLNRAALSGHQVLAEPERLRLVID